jgi:hypothetical protein
MTFRDKYRKETKWNHKVLIMEIFHLARSTNSGKWTILDTAKYFGVSMGLVSENLKLARAIHKDQSVLEAKDRQTALEIIR